mmetsp:Transcript_109174/g.213924  ORF Transcript_109174/g.213924 Transcript_109174/m.213924 type:complete len:256 (-) Transcript_109174:79-846(-)
MERIVSERPVDHAAAVPDFVALLEEAEVVDILHVGVDGVDVLALRQLVHNAHVHEDLVALATTVQESFAAAEPQGHMLAVASAASASDHTFCVDGRYQHRVLDGAEGPDERRRLQILIELDDAQDVLRLLVDDGEAHVAAELIVGLLREIFGVHDRAFGADAPIPVRVDEAEIVGVARHERLHILRHGLRVQLEVFRQHTPPMAVTPAGLHAARSCSGQHLPANQRCSGTPERAASDMPCQAEHCGRVRGLGGLA